jgi:hypothetical protein
MASAHLPLTARPDALRHTAAYRRGWVRQHLCVTAAANVGRGRADWSVLSFDLEEPTDPLHGAGHAVRCDGPIPMQCQEQRLSLTVAAAGPDQQGAQRAELFRPQTKDRAEVGPLTTSQTADLLSAIRYTRYRMAI